MFLPNAGYFLKSQKLGFIKNNQLYMYAESVGTLFKLQSDSVQLETFILAECLLVIFCQRIVQSDSV